MSKARTRLSSKTKEERDNIVARSDDDVSIVNNSKILLEGSEEGKMIEKKESVENVEKKEEIMIENKEEEKEKTEEINNNENDIKETKNEKKEEENDEINENNNKNNEEVKENKENKIEDTPEIESCKKDILISLLSKDVESLQQNLEKLRQLNGDINYSEGKDGLTLLHRCVIQGTSIEIVKTLIEEGANVESRNLRGLSPLHAASQKGDLGIIELLLEYNANILQKDFENKTCLHWSAIGGHIECIDFFVRNNVLINLKDNNGYAAIHYAVKHNHYNCIKYLLNNGADALIVDGQGLRPIDLIAGYKEKKLSNDGKKIEKLLKKSGGHKSFANLQSFGMAVGGGVSHKNNNDNRSSPTPEPKSRRKNFRNSVSHSSVREIQPHSSSSSSSSLTSNHNNINNSTGNINIINGKKSAKRIDSQPNLSNLVRKESSANDNNNDNNNGEFTVVKSVYNKYGFKEEGDMPSVPVDKESFKRENELTKKWLALKRNWDMKKYHSKVRLLIFYLFLFII